MICNLFFVRNFLTFGNKDSWDSQIDSSKDCINREFEDSYAIGGEKSVKRTSLNDTEVFEDEGDVNLMDLMMDPKMYS